MSTNGFDPFPLITSAGPGLTFTMDTLHVKVEGVLKDSNEPITVRLLADSVPVKVALEPHSVPLAWMPPDTSSWYCGLVRPTPT